MQNGKRIKENGGTKLPSVRASRRQGSFGKYAVEPVRLHFDCPTMSDAQCDEQKKKWFS